MCRMCSRRVETPEAILCFSAYGGEEMNSADAGTERLTMKKGRSKENKTRQDSMKEKDDISHPNQVSKSKGQRQLSSEVYTRGQIYTYLCIHTPITDHSAVYSPPPLHPHPIICCPFFINSLIILLIHPYINHASPPSF